MSDNFSEAEVQKKSENDLAQVKFFETPKKLEYLKKFTFLKFATQALSIV